MLNSVTITLHILASVIWVGGMFFAHMALRPAANDLLPPAQRLPLLHGVLARFFRWVWLAVPAILVTGYLILFGLWGGRAGLYVHAMQGLGLLMALLYSYIYFFPFKALGVALRDQNIKLAAGQMAIIRRIIGLNLILGLVTICLAAAKPV